MTFDKILENNTLWAVRYDNEEDNSLRTVFNQWNDPEWLWNSGKRTYIARIEKDGICKKPFNRTGCYRRCRIC